MINSVNLTFSSTFHGKIIPEPLTVEENKFIVAVGWWVMGGSIRSESCHRSSSIPAIYHLFILYPYRFFPSMSFDSGSLPLPLRQSRSLWTNALPWSERTLHTLWERLYSKLPRRSNIKLKQYNIVIKVSFALFCYANCTFPLSAGRPAATKSWTWARLFQWIVHFWFLVHPRFAILKWFFLF